MDDDDLFTIKGQKPKQKSFGGDGSEEQNRPALKPSTRLIVRNLPKHLTEQRLREHFSQKGDVTDVKIMRTKEGRSRLFGFVGFPTIEAAKQARQFYDSSYLDTSKIMVDYAQPIGDANVPRAWSKYSKGSSAFQKRQEAEEKPKAPKPTPAQLAATAKSKDAKLEDFLSTMKKGNKVWMNDDSGITQIAEDVSKPKKVKKDKAEIAVQAVPNKKPGGAGLFVTRSHVTFNEDENESDDDYQDLPAAKRAKVTADGEAEQNNADDNDDSSESENRDDDDKMDTDEPAEPAAAPASSHLDWLRSKMTKSIDVDKLEEEEAQSPAAADESNEKTEKDGEEDQKSGSKSSKSSSSSSSSSASGSGSSSSSSDSDDEQESTPATIAANAQPQSQPGQYQHAGTMEDLAQLGRIFVRNLSYTTTEDDLYKLFSKYGQISEVHITVDKTTKQSRGFGFVQFLIPAQAVKAFQELDAKIFQGRLLHLIPAKPLQRKEANPTKKADVKFQTDFQKKKEEKMKEMAGQDFNWSSLFIRPDTVAQAMAAQFNVEKGELFDKENQGSLGVRLALGETNIIADTKKFLQREGVSLEALQGVYNKDIERSPTTILVKNIPFSATVDEFRNLFSRFGELTKVVMPATKALALVEFAVPQEARSAFRGLAYKQFKDAPLYLEWAPVGVIKPASAKTASVEEAEEEEQVTPAAAAPAELDEDIDSDPTQTTLFIKNLNFDTSDETFKKTVEQLIGKVRSATIARRKDEAGRVLSQGFGFVECSSRDQAMNGYKKLAGVTIDGHALKVSFSARGNADTAKANSKKRKRVSRDANASTKIMVRNVPFQASKKEIRELFAAFGELKSVRLPNKAGGQGHRGFAFIEYLTKDEAKAAMEALENTRLYGRHLVLEFASEADETQDVDALRAKTTKLYQKTHESQ